MRDILFRGKTPRQDEHFDDGEWVEGFYTRFNEKEHRIYSGYAETDCGDYYPDWYNVRPETVGQYTGLTDKNGKKVFEGDIVKCTDTTYYYSLTTVVIFGNPNGEYNWGFQLKRISGASANTDILLWFDMEDVGACAEVVGNIHDNPELLKGGE